MTTTDIGSRAKSLIDANERFKRIQKEFPKYATEVQRLISSYLREYDIKRWKVFIGRADDQFYNERWHFETIQRQFCKYLVFIDKERKKDSTWNAWLNSEEGVFKLEAYFRDWLELPPLVIKAGTKYKTFKSRAKILQ